MNNNAKNITEFFEISGDKKDDLIALDMMMRRIAPSQKRQLFSGKSITMLGYGEMDWKTKSESGVWPLISIAPQKNNISIYIAAEKDGVPLPTIYGKDKLGKVNNGKNCIRFRSLKGVNLEVLEEAILIAIKWNEEQQQNFGRNCARPVE